MSIHNSKHISDVKILLKTGVDGAGIKNIEKTGASGLVDTYTITLEDGKKFTFNVANGNGIADIEKTDTSGLTDTYTITFDDESTREYTVVNGNGIANIKKTGTSGHIDTYTITFDDGSTSTFEVRNGDGSIASDIVYENTSSELDATNVQDAIDEIDVSIDDMNNILGAKNILPNGATTITTNGITFTVNANGTVKATGTATADASLVLTSSFYVGNGRKVILSGCPSGGSTSKYFMYLTNENGNTSKGNDVGSGVTVTADADNLGCRILIKKNQALGTTGITFSPMVRLANIRNASYVPYAMTNRELSLQISNFTKVPNYSTNGDLKYRKIGALVELSCRVDSKLDGYTLGTLPAGYRPTDYILLASDIAPSQGRAQINPTTGVVTWQNTTGSGVNVRIHAMYYATQ